MGLVEILSILQTTRSLALTSERVGVSKQAISKRFKKLLDTDPLKVAYFEALGTPGRKKKHGSDRDRWRENKRAQRAKDQPSSTTTGAIANISASGVCRDLAVIVSVSTVPTVHDAPETVSVETSITRSTS